MQNSHSVVLSLVAHVNFHHFHSSHCTMHTEYHIVVHHAIRTSSELNGSTTPCSIPLHIKHLLDILFLWNPIELNAESSCTLNRNTEKYFERSRYVQRKVYYLRFQWDKLAWVQPDYRSFSVTLEFIQCVMSCKLTINSSKPWRS